MPIRLNQRPPLIISFILTYPDPNTMACVGEATGIMKAQLAESVAGIINKVGSIFIALEASAIMGSTKLVMAVFEVISVRNVRMKETEKTATVGDCNFILANPSQTRSPKPDNWNPPAKASPPPNKSNIPQGTFFVSAQFNIFCFGLDFDGTTKSNIAAKIATAASLNSGRFNRLRHPLSCSCSPICMSEPVSQRIAAKRKIPPALFSSAVILPNLLYFS